MTIGRPVLRPSIARAAGTKARSERLPPEAVQAILRREANRVPFAEVTLFHS
jgi:hypothetical protein